MREEARLNPVYDRDTHNCCTVAFETLRKINKNTSKFFLDLLHIKKRNFNIFGHGISFDSGDDSILDYIEGSGRIFSDSLSIAPKVIIRSIENTVGSEYVEAEHDRDKEEL